MLCSTAARLLITETTTTMPTNWRNALSTVMEDISMGETDCPPRDIYSGNL